MITLLKNGLYRLVVFLIIIFPFAANSQKGIASNTNLVYVDKQGVIRYTANNAEAAFFGVNYTVPFAYGYRSVKRMGVDVEKEIDNDVYHFSKLGVNAFRVHVWDTEISDSLGNLLNNEHLRLFDYLVAKLKERHIKILITPIAFWGNGYPEKDSNTGSFSSVYGKQQAVLDERAIKAQEKYLDQFFRHVNPYTKLTYRQDIDVVATEINNEPHHTGPKARTTEYVDRLANAIRKSGWSKPVFYNISESPAYADAVVKAKVDGHSFQWYPTGLVANRTLEGNYLPHVATYHIPFDTIADFNKRAKMVYEFDAGDVLQSIMYPAMARSFRAAGMQWATQFAYDPLATAYANTEYQTHYLNLAYTPAKAISLLIAAKVFHSQPRGVDKSTATSDSLFGDFIISYNRQLSQMNSPEEFYHSNSTTSSPVDVTRLKKIAGVGSSPIVKYKGTGAYFLDRLNENMWRLEVMPDAIFIRDPFDKASPSKEVSRIQWNSQEMELLLPSLGQNFNIRAIDSRNTYAPRVNGYKFSIRPGVYIISSQQVNKEAVDLSKVSKEFVAPTPFDTTPFVAHTPIGYVTEGKPFTLHFNIAGVHSPNQLAVEIRNTANKWKTVQPVAHSPIHYTAEVPADMVSIGAIEYRMIVKKSDNKILVFPGSHKGDPYAWDNYITETWQTNVASPIVKLPLFDLNVDRKNINIYNNDWKNNQVSYITADDPSQLILRLSASKTTKTPLFGFQLYIGDRWSGRMSELNNFKTLVMNAKSWDTAYTSIKITLVDCFGKAFSTEKPFTFVMEAVEVPLSEFKPDSLLLLPRPYPAFQPLKYKSASTNPLVLKDIEQLQVTYVPVSSEENIPPTIEINTIFLKPTF